METHRGEAILQIKIEDVNCEPRSTWLQRPCSSNYASLWQPFPKPKLATVAVGTTPDLLMRSSPAPIARYGAVVMNVGAWVISHFLTMVCGLYLWPFIYICILCHCSHFHSVGEQHQVISPHCLIFASTYNLTFHLVNASSFFPFSTLYSWCGEKIRCACIKGTWMAVSFSPPPPMNSSMLVWRIMEQKTPKKPKNKKKVMHNHTISLPAKHFSKMARCMQFITYKVHHSYL